MCQPTCNDLHVRALTTALGWMALAEESRALRTCSSIRHIMQKPCWSPEGVGKQS